MSQGQVQSRKRKQTQQSPTDADLQEPATKKSKRSSKRKVKEQSTGEFQVVNSTLVVSIPPIYACNPTRGVQEMLDSMIMRYVPALRGVVIAHSNLKFLDRTSTIKGDCPFATCRVSFDVTVWTPQVGKVKLCSPDHIALLVHNVFNAAIYRHHIPTDHWEFEYGPADNDSEFASEVVAAAAAVPAASDGDVEMAESSNRTGQTDAAAEPSVKTSTAGGKWVHKLTSDPIGDSEGYLEFVVIGLTMANQMLSVVGSIQPDPFSPHHVPLISSPTQSEQDDEVAVLNELEVGAERAAVDSDDEDVFAHLGKLADEAREAELRAREEVEATAQKEKPKKKKRKKAENDTSERKKEKKLKRKKT